MSELAEEGYESATGRTTVRVAWGLLKGDPRTYATAWLMWVAFHTFPLPIGWAFKVVLDRVTDDATLTSAWGAVALLGGLEVTRWALLVAAAVQWHGAWVRWLTVPRVNLLRSLVVAPGPAAGRLPGSPGEAVSRFRDDTHDLAMVLDVWLDISGAVLAGISAVVVMVTIDSRVTFAVVLPVVAALGFASWLGPRLRAWRQAARQATAEVTSFVGDSFGSVLAIKAAGAERGALIRFAGLNSTRATAARRDQVGSQLVQSLAGATGEAGIGLMLLMVAPAITRGEFTVGELGLFTSYVTVLAAVPRWAGRLGAWHRQAEVSVHRLAALLPDADPDGVVAPTTTYLRHGPPPFTTPPYARDRLDELVVRGLTVRHGGDGGRGITHVDLTVRRGEIVVVTGPVGAGKSTLLRAVLGLVRHEAGTITWNGAPVYEPSTFLVPSRAAYVPQVPRLFSESIADTVLLGLPIERLVEALWLACMEDDVAAMPLGADTLVGPRGVRLSGGQLQRTGAARALARLPELLVVDDLSSALDVETETRLWQRLLDGGVHTAIVVSHRPRVLAAADRVITLDHGRVVAAL